MSITDLTKVINVNRRGADSDHLDHQNKINHSLTGILLALALILSNNTFASG